MVIKKAKARSKGHHVPPKFHHLDRRATTIIASGAGDDDDLLSSSEVAHWFGVSVEWLNQGRMKGYGPKFTKMSERVIRYRRGDCREYLRARSYQSTAEYAEAVR
jgi:hypothetical protein